MSVWYRVHFGWRDDAVQFREASVERETEACLFVKQDSGRTARTNKLSEYERWFPSKREALEDARATAAKKLEVLKGSVAHAERRIAGIDSALESAK